MKLAYAEPCTKSNPNHTCVVVTNSLFSSVHHPQMCMILQGTPDLLSAMSGWAAPRQY